MARKKKKKQVTEWMDIRPEDASGAPTDEDRKVVEAEQTFFGGHQERKAWKSASRKVIKKHYFLFVILCLVAAFYGTELQFVQYHGESMYSAISGQVTQIGSGNFKMDTGKAWERVYNDLMNEDLEGGRNSAKEALGKLVEHTDKDAIMGRSRGILAGVANYVSSGNMALQFVGIFHNLTHSSKVSAGILMVLSLLFSLAIWIFLKNVYKGILRRMFLEARLYEEVPIGHLLHFKLVNRWIRASMTLFLTSIFHFLWSLTVVGYFIKRYSYMMVPFIVAENPDIKPRDAITLSRRMMDGHKWECFKLDLSFLGWNILGLFTFGFSDALWSAPYQISTFGEYYCYLRSLAKVKGIEGAEALNDRYLFEKAEEDYLREIYVDVEAQKYYIDTHRVSLPPVKAFFAKNFSLWVGTVKEKQIYDDVDNRRQQIAEDRSAIKCRVYPQRLNPAWDSRHNHLVGALRSLKTYTIWSIIMVFFAFSLVGWLWEVSLHLLQDGVFVNRGTLHGPWIPIYGGGVAMIVVLLARFRRKPLQEIVSIIILCGIVEYTTSYVLEVTKGMRWWDYTGYFLNLNGRICAEGLLVFALGGAAAVYLAVPLLDGLWSKINVKILAPICILLLGCFVADIVYTNDHPNVGEGITDYDAYKDSSLVRFYEEGPGSEEYARLPLLSLRQ